VANSLQMHAQASDASILLTVGPHTTSLEHYQLEQLGIAS